MNKFEDGGSAFPSNRDIRYEQEFEHEGGMTLRQRPDPLRLAIQGQAKRIDDTVCILAGRPLYKPSTCGD